MLVNYVKVICFMVSLSAQAAKLMLRKLHKNTVNLTQGWGGVGWRMGGGEAAIPLVASLV